MSYTGVEATLKATHLAEWSAIAIWDPQTRYNPVGVINPTNATLMVNSAKTLLKIL